MGNRFAADCMTLDELRQAGYQLQKQVDEIDPNTGGGGTLTPGVALELRPTDTTVIDVRPDYETIGVDAQNRIYVINPGGGGGDPVLYAAGIGLTLDAGNTFNAKIDGVTIKVDDNNTLYAVNQGGGGGGGGNGDIAIGTLTGNLSTSSQAGTISITYSTNGQTGSISADNPIDQLYIPPTGGAQRRLFQGNFGSFAVAGLFGSTWRLLVVEPPTTITG